MPRETDDRARYDELRRRAEEIADAMLPGGDAARTSPDGTANTLHELSVHQIELEMQNEELRNTQEKLEAARARYFDLYDLAPAGYLSLDQAGLISEANLTIASLLGVARATMAGTPLDRFVVAEDEDVFFRFRRRIAAGGDPPHSCELRLKVEGAAPIWARLDAIAAQDAEGSPVVRVIVTDITRRVEADLELEEDAARLKEALALLSTQMSLLAEAEAIGHVGTWRADVKSGDLRWSDEAKRILGLAFESSDGGEFEALRAAVHPDDRQLFDGPEARTRWTDRSLSTDFRIVRPDGETRWVSARGSTEMGEDGAPVVITGILLDVTERKRADEERIDDLEQAANLDRLTGLHNRRGFDLLADQAIAQAERSGQSIGLIFCDMDGLKSINDEFGHVQGDRALKDAASVMGFTLRNADAIARIGGDEFVVLTIGNDREGLTHLNERLQEGFEFFNATNERPYRLSVSSGSAWCEPGTRCRLEELRESADSEMYVEKQRRKAGQPVTRDTDRPTDD